MASKTGYNEEDPVTGIRLSARELEIIAKVWQSFEEPPKINWQKLADTANFKNVSSARACFAPIKRKLIRAAEGTTEAEPKKSSTSANNGGKRKATTQKTLGARKKAKTTEPISPSTEPDEDGGN